MRKIILILSLLFCLQSNGQTFLHGGTVSFYCNGDPALTKYLYATGIRDSLTRANLCWLVDTLKSTGRWDTLAVFNPLAGGTSSSCSYNLVDTGTFKTVFTGTLSFNYTGVAGNGSTGFGDFGFKPTTQWTDTLGAIGLHSRTVGAGAGTITEMGASNTAYTTNTSIFINFGNTFYGLLNCNWINSNTGNTASDGTYIASRFSHTGPVRNYIQKNTTQTNFTENAGIPDFNLYVWAINENGTAKNFSSKELTCFFVCKYGLSPEGGLVMQKIISSYNSKMGR